MKQSKPVFIIAEIGNNHNGDRKTALKLIEEFAKAGADAVKFQAFKPHDIVSPLVLTTAYKSWGVNKSFKNWQEFLESLTLPYEFFPELVKCAHRFKAQFWCTSTSFESATMLKKCGTDGIKIASMDLNYIPLLRHINKLKLPVILSTGMGELAEIKKADSIFANKRPFILHCVSNYPLNAQDANLRNITMLQNELGTRIGFSDHSLGWNLDLAAVALGAKVIEKHVTLNRKSKKIAEHHFSLEPHEFAEMVKSIREVEASMGHYHRILGTKEMKSRKQYRRSLFLTQNYKAGDKVKKEDVLCVRPATSLEPAFYDSIVGKKTLVNIKAFQPLETKFFKRKI